MKRRFMAPSRRMATEPKPFMPPWDSSRTSDRKRSKSTWYRPSPRKPMAPAKSSAELPTNTCVRMSTEHPSNIDVDDAADDEDAQHFHDRDDHHEDPPEEVVHHGLHQVGPHVVEHHAQHAGHGRHDPPLQLALRSEGVDLALQAEALANHGGHGLEHLRHVAAELARDVGGHHHQLQVVAAHALAHVDERLFQRDAQLHFLHEQAELLRQRRHRLARHVLDGLREGETGLERVGHGLQRVHQLDVELLDAPLAVVLDHQHRQEEAEHRGHDGQDGVEDDVGQDAQQAHARDVEDQHLTRIDEEEHVAQVVHRLGDVALLVLLIRLREDAEDHQAEEEDRACDEEEDDSGKHGRASLGVRAAWRRLLGASGGGLLAAALDDLDDLPALGFQHAGTLTGQQGADGGAAALLDEVDVVLVAQAERQCAQLRGQHEDLRLFRQHHQRHVVVVALAFRDEVDVGGTGDLSGRHHDDVLQQRHADVLVRLRVAERADDVHVVIRANPAADGGGVLRLDGHRAHLLLHLRGQALGGLGRLELAPQQRITRLQRHEHLLVHYVGRRVRTNHRRGDELLRHRALGDHLEGDDGAFGDVLGRDHHGYQVPAAAHVGFLLLDGGIRDDTGEKAEYERDDERGLALQHGSGTSKTGGRRSAAKAFEGVEI